MEAPQRGVEGHPNREIAGGEQGHDAGADLSIGPGAPYIPLLAKRTPVTATGGSSPVPCVGLKWKRYFELEVQGEVLGTMSLPSPPPC